jgi:hypothetical protein
VTWRTFSAVVAAVLLLAAAAFAADDELSGDERAAAIRQVEKNRLEWVVIETIYIVRRNVTVRGVSGNPNAIANFLESLKADPLFEKPTIRFLRAREGSKPVQYEFEMAVDVKRPQPE